MALFAFNLSVQCLHLQYVEEVKKEKPYYNSATSFATNTTPMSTFCTVYKVLLQKNTIK